MGGVCQRLFMMRDESQLTDLSMQSSIQDVPERTKPPEEPLNTNLQRRQETNEAILEEIPPASEDNVLYKGTRQALLEEIPPASENDVQYKGTSQAVLEEIPPTTENDVQYKGTSQAVIEEIPPPSQNDVQYESTSQAVIEEIPPATENDVQYKGTSQAVIEEIPPASQNDVQYKSNSQAVLAEIPSASLNDVKFKGTSQAVLEEIPSASMNDVPYKVTSQAVLEEITPSSKDNLLYKDIKEDIITYYREHESQIPAAPLIEEHKVDLEDLYVLPPLYAYDDPFRFGPDYERHKGLQTSINDASKRQIVTVNQIFLSKNIRYKKIYITANAGFGKTSLSQKLTMTWCQAQSPLKSLTEKYEDDELDALKYFDFLFLLHLRDYQSEHKCNLDDLIMQMVAENLSRNILYTQEFLQRLLHEKKCLIVIDGLDEWVHPVKCNKTPAVPHNNHPNSCTVITTSRPWKLGTIGLSKNHIDRHIVIAELDEETCAKLYLNAFQILNDNQLNLVRKDISDFADEVEQIGIDDIIFIPYILLQLMCLFFGGLPFGKSKCELYSSITEFTLKRSLNKKNLPHLHVQSIYKTVVPNCMKENETCKLYISLIIKLGKLAFSTLIGEKKESCLIFDRKVVTQFMTEQEIDFCLKVGLLCQTKDNSILAERRYKVFFQHKSVQEFFSAIYILSEWENNTVKLTIFNACSSLTRTLEMTNLFIFVCGMNHEVYTCISGELQKIVGFDVMRLRFMSDMYTPYEPIYLDDWKTMMFYQSMQVQCFQESMRNRNESCSIKLYDIVVDDSLTEDDLTVLKTFVNSFNDNVKSLNTMNRDENIEDFMILLDPVVFTSLETLRVDRCDKEPVWLVNNITKYARTLKCLILSGPSVTERLSLSDMSITALAGLTCLQSLFLRFVNMRHSNLNHLYAYISQTTTLTQLKLWAIRCLDHKNQDHRDCDVTLDLHLLNGMKMLFLYLVPCSELNVNLSCLEKFEFAPRWMTARASASLLEDLRTAPALTSLGLGNMPACQTIQINHILTQLQHQLQYFKLANINMCDVIPHLPPAMTKLECVNIVGVKFSSADWRGLLHSAGQLPQSITIRLSNITIATQEWRELLLSVGGLQQAITLELKDCKGPSREEWTELVDVIKSTSTLSLLQDLSINDKSWASLTMEKQ